MYILVIRVFLLSIAIYLYTSTENIINFTTSPHGIIDGLFLYAVWFMLAAGMLRRLFPNKNVAIGARKHFSNSQKVDIPAINKDASKRLHKGAAGIAVTWAILNTTLFFLLNYWGALTPGVSLIAVLIYSVIDVVFILFFCPFQKIFMHNRCCATCRIYNWDYFMMCTPLFLFPSIYAISLLLIASAVLLNWEISLRLSPQKFIPETNKQLNCPQCADKLCLLKKS